MCSEAPFCKKMVNPSPHVQTETLRGDTPPLLFPVNSRLPGVFEPNTHSQRVLGSCRDRGYDARGKRAAENLIVAGPGGSSALARLSKEGERGSRPPPKTPRRQPFLPRPSPWKTTATDKQAERLSPEARRAPGPRHGSLYIGAKRRPSPVGGGRPQCVGTVARGSSVPSTPFCRWPNTARKK